MFKTLQQKSAEKTFVEKFDDSIKDVAACLAYHRTFLQASQFNQIWTTSNVVLMKCLYKKNETHNGIIRDEKLNVKSWIFETSRYNFSDVVMLYR